MTRMFGFFWSCPDEVTAARISPTVTNAITINLLYMFGLFMVTFLPLVASFTCRSPPACRGPAYPCCSRTRRSRLLLDERLRYPDNAEHDGLTLRAIACAKLGLISCEQRQSWFGNVNVELGAKREYSILDSPQDWRNVRAAIASDFELGVSGDAQVHNHWDGAVNFLVQRLAKASFNRPQVADVN